MRNRHGFHEKFLEPGFDSGLDFFDPAYQLLDLASRALVQQGDPCACTRCIAGRTDLLKLAIAIALLSTAIAVPLSNIPAGEGEFFLHIQIALVASFT